ncbi:Cell division control protein 25 [Zancudomyces culisetae]|uniref:Cell division control protein 25 n=1 Tax=Zancudomyces culisetae TaxID=1213189 RepID=A0A1R1PL20_ZANCU|nr:Cell division control protein 25 [Zancudomyces culisetae]|eukprot:OMH81656.1 Cell division control protein 25 [Zancudomyces culisetae]
MDERVLSYSLIKLKDVERVAGESSLYEIVKKTKDLKHDVCRDFLHRDFDDLIKHSENAFNNEHPVIIELKKLKWAYDVLRTKIKLVKENEISKRTKSDDTLSEKAENLDMQEVFIENQDLFVSADTSTSRPKLKLKKSIVDFFSNSKTRKQSIGGKKGDISHVKSISEASTNTQNSGIKQFDNCTHDQVHDFKSHDHVQFSMSQPHIVSGESEQQLDREKTIKVLTFGNDSWEMISDSIHGNLEVGKNGYTSSFGSFLQNKGGKKLSSGSKKMGGSSMLFDKLTEALDSHNNKNDARSHESKGILFDSLVSMKNRKRHESSSSNVSDVSTTSATSSNSCGSSNRSSISNNSVGIHIENHDSFQQKSNPNNYHQMQRDERCIQIDRLSSDFELVCETKYLSEDLEKPPKQQSLLGRLIKSRTEPPTTRKEERSQKVLVRSRAQRKKSNTNMDASVHSYFSEFGKSHYGSAGLGELVSRSNSNSSGLGSSNFNTLINELDSKVKTWFSSATGTVKQKPTSAGPEKDNYDMFTTLVSQDCYENLLPKTPLYKSRMSTGEGKQAFPKLDDMDITDSLPSPQSQPTSNYASTEKNAKHDSISNESMVFSTGLNGSIDPYEMRRTILKDGDYVGHGMDSFLGGNKNSNRKNSSYSINFNVNKNRFGMIAEQPFKLNSNNLPAFENMHSIVHERRPSAHKLLHTRSASNDQQSQKQSSKPALEVKIGEGGAENPNMYSSFADLPQNSPQRTSPRGKDIPAKLGSKSVCDLKSRCKVETTMNAGLYPITRSISNQLVRAQISNNKGGDSFEVSNEYWYLEPEYTQTELDIIDGKLMGGTIRALVEHLTPHNTTADSDFVNAFLLTFRSFCTPLELLNHLIRRFNMEPPNEISGDADKLQTWRLKKQTPARLRVCNVLKSWLESYFYPARDFYIIQEFEAFINNFLITNGQKSSGVRMLELIKEIYAEYNISGTVSFTNRSKAIDRMLRSKFANMASLPPPPSHRLSKRVTSLLVKNKPVNLLEIDQLELARQLTVCDSMLFCSIRPYELIDRKIARSTDSLCPPSVKLMSSISNKITHWVIMCVLSENSAKQRAVVLKYMINVAYHCFLLNNFNTLFSFVSAFNSSFLSRLKLTWSFLGSKYNSMLSVLQKITDSSRNYCVYRNYLQSTSHALPFLGIILTDLTFANHGNRNFRHENYPPPLQSATSTASFAILPSLSSPISPTNSGTLTPISAPISTPISASTSFPILSPNNNDNLNNDLLDLPKLSKNALGSFFISSDFTDLISSENTDFMLTDPILSPDPDPESPETPDLSDLLTSSSNLPMINFSKYTRAVSIIQSVQTFQVPYNLTMITEIVEYLQFSLNLAESHWDDEKYYQRSLLLEPKSSNK